MTARVFLLSQHSSNVSHVAGIHPESGFFREKQGVFKNG
jgi:hypothetical protein